MLSLDALFGLPRKKSAGTSHRDALHGDLFFCDQAAVDEYVVSYEMRTNKIPNVNMLHIIYRNVIYCTLHCRHVIIFWLVMSFDHLGGTMLLLKLLCLVLPVGMNSLTYFLI